MIVGKLPERPRTSPKLKVTVKYKLRTRCASPKRHTHTQRERERERRNDNWIEYSMPLIVLGRVARSRNKG